MGIEIVADRRVRGEPSEQIHAFVLNCECGYESSKNQKGVFFQVEEIDRYRLTAECPVCEEMYYYII